MITFVSRVQLGIDPFMELNYIHSGIGMAMGIALIMTYMAYDHLDSRQISPAIKKPAVLGLQHSSATKFENIMCQSKLRRHKPEHKTNPFEISPKATAIDGVYFLGCLRTDQNYSIYSVALDNKRTGPDYIFYTPLTAVAWKRVGFYSVVVMSLIMDDAGDWRRDPVLQLMVKYTLDQKAFILFLKTDYNHTIKVLPCASLSSLILSAVFAKYEY